MDTHTLPSTLPHSIHSHRAIADACLSCSSAHCAPLLASAVCSRRTDTARAGESVARATPSRCPKRCHTRPSLSLPSSLVRRLHIMALTSDEINFLIYRYLRESGTLSAHTRKLTRYPLTSARLILRPLSAACSVPQVSSTVRTRSVTSRSCTSHLSTRQPSHPALSSRSFRRVCSTRRSRPISPTTAVKWCAMSRSLSPSHTSVANETSAVCTRRTTPSTWTTAGWKWTEPCVWWERVC